MRERAQALLKQARISDTLGRSEQAERLYEQAIDLLSNGGWAEDRSMASALSGLGLHYMRQKRYVRALPLFQRSLAIYRRSLDENHPTVLAIKTGLSEIKGFIEKQMP
jgi:tetratricopeptide (TPR) repeat protein